MTDPYGKAALRQVRSGPQALLTGSIAASLALTRASGFPGLGDTDAYAHMEYARQLLASGFSLRGHPYLPFTTLGDSGVDLWWGFHLLISPFTVFDNVWGARLAGAFLAAITAGGLALLLHRLGQRHAWLFVVAPLIWCNAYAFRAHLARPAHMTALLVVIALVAGAGAIRARWALGAGVLHGLSHLSAPLSPMMAAIGLIAALVSATQRPNVAAPDWRRGVRGLFASALGVSVGLLLRPDPGAYVATALQTALQALGGSGPGQLPHTAPELLPPSLEVLAIELAPVTFLLILGLWLGRHQRAGGLASRAALVGAVGVLLLMALRSARFVEYLVPVMGFAAGLFWPRRLELGSRARWAAATGVLVASLAIAAWNLTHSWKGVGELLDPPETFASMADEVRARVAPGSVLFTDDPFATEILYSYMPEYRFVVAWDPALLYNRSPEAFWRWHHAVARGIDCSVPHCGSRAPSPEAVARVVSSFGASYVVTSYPEGRLSMQQVMRRHPDHFSWIGYASGTATGLHLWRVRSPAAAPKLATEP